MRTPVIGVKRCRGISLIELLLSLMAVMIVASLAWKAGAAAIAFANNSRVTLEISQLSRALEAFQLQFGDYPPDFHDSVTVAKFIKQRFPKCQVKNLPDMGSYGPASALCFWLAGPNGRGFSTNPANPFDNGPHRIGPFFQFASDRLKKVDGVMQYYPPRGINGSPYVYFRGGAKGYDGNRGWPPALPYRKSSDGSWINSDSYQILCPGSDGKYGSGNHFPGGSDCSDANLDDMANFTQGNTMEQAKTPKP